MQGQRQQPLVETLRLCFAEVSNAESSRATELKRHADRIAVGLG
jgi:hypothetical protein